MQAQTRSKPTQRRIDVTDLPTDAVAAYARAQRAHVDELSLERRGAHTYLVVSE